MTRTILLGLVVVLTPVVGQASCGAHKDDVVMSCSVGTVYDAEKQACVATTS